MDYLDYKQFGLDEPFIDKDVISFDRTLRYVGGFGLFQVGATAILIANMVSSSHLIYGLTFLTKNPSYECMDSTTMEYSTCSKQFICGSQLTGNDVVWRIDYTKEESFFNWVDPSKLDLTCESGNNIGMIGSAAYLGFAISSAVMPKMSDKYGRKMAMLVCLVFNAIAYWQVMVSTSIEYTIKLYFVLGLCSGGRVGVLLTYLNELVPAETRGTVTTFANICDSFVLLQQALYFTDNKNWKPFHDLVLLTTALGLVLSLFLPESPQYLYDQKRFDECRESLSFIEKINAKVKPQKREGIRHKLFEPEAHAELSKSLILHSQMMDSRTESTGETTMYNLPDLVEPNTDIKVELQENYNMRVNCLALIILFPSICFSCTMMGFFQKQIPGYLTTNTFFQ